MCLCGIEGAWHAAWRPSSRTSYTTATHESEDSCQELIAFQSTPTVAFLVATIRVIGVNMWMWLEWLVNHLPVNLPCQQKVLHRTPFLFSGINFLLHRTLCYTKICPAELILLHYTAPSPPFLFRTQKNVRTPTTTTSQKSIAMHLQFVLQYASNLYCSAFGAPTLGGKGNIVSTPPICIAVRLPFVLQYASHSHRSTFEKSWWLWSQCQIPPQKAGMLLAHTLDFACKRQACRQRAKDAEHCNKLEAQICWDSHRWLICENGRAWGPRFRVQILHHNLGQGVNFIRGKFLFTYSWNFFAYSWVVCLQFTEVLSRYTFPL